MNPEPFRQLDRIIHEKGRLVIMSVLAASKTLSFTEIRNLLQMTDGNLSMHIKTLQEAGYICVEKEMGGRKARTMYSLTSEGEQAFRRYVELLDQIVEFTKKKP
ncbi:MAG: transcriptional regulator [Verrucomicrobia bacterium]|nr:transcriptional regulator [Verrucomicrobiota bacterium]MCF7707773.1 transcriptional regulator [Verrucomicrobiota bacterium]